VHADRLDRPIEHDLALGDLRSFGRKRFDDVARGHRAVKLPGVRRLANQLYGFSIDALGRLFRISAALGVFRLDARPIGFEQLAIGIVGAKRLLIGQQIVAGKAVLELDHVADAAELFDAFEQDDVHVPASLFHDVGKQADMARALDRAGQLTLLLG
jgi:hypothetical protein